MKVRHWIALAVLLAGCGGQSDEKEVIDAAGNRSTVTTDGGGKTLTYEGADGTTVEMRIGDGSLALPQEFPKDASVFPNATVTKVTRMRLGLSLNWKTTASFDEVVKFFEEDSKQNGWAETSPRRFKDRVSFDTRKETRLQTVNVRQHEGTTTIETSLLTLPQ